MLLIETERGTLVLDHLEPAVRSWSETRYLFESRERPDGRWDRFDQSAWPR